MFVRFQCRVVNEITGKGLGILVAAKEMVQRGVIEGGEKKEVINLLKWFVNNLYSPKCLKSRKNRRSLSWFKASAKDHIDRMWQLSAILQNHGCLIEFVQTREVDPIIYDDKYQVVQAL